MLKKLSEKKQYISDFAYTIGSSLLLQAVLHLLIHPYINYRMGAEALGNIVFYMSIIYIFAQSLGQGLCQIRQVVRKDCEASNGDYNAIIAVILLISAVCGGIIGSIYLKGIELLMFVGSAFLNYLFGLWIDKERGTKLDKLPITIALLYNFGMLGVFKYTDFMINNINSIFGTSIPEQNIGLPLGISFYTFQVVSYIIDVYWEKVPEAFALHLSFPTIGCRAYCTLSNHC